MIKLHFRVHAMQRMYERGVSVAEIRQVIERGKVIEADHDAVPLPTRLIAGRVRGRNVHVVVGDPGSTAELVVITLYEPDPDFWHPGFRRRR